MLFVLIEPSFGAGTLHREVEHEYLHLKHVLALRRHGFACKDLMSFHVCVSCILDRWVQSVRILRMVKYFESLHD